MIKVSVARVDDLPPGNLRAIQVFDQKVLLARTPDGLWHAFAATCPHAGAPLEKGALCDDRIICPWHKSCFASASGALLEPPSLESLRKYPVEIVGEEVTIDLGQPRLEQRAPGSVTIAPHVDQTFVIVGGGPAGISAAQHLRALGFVGRLVMINKENRPPYDRTMLSKMYLSGKAGPERLPLRPETLLRDQRIELLAREVASLDPHAQRITFTDGIAPLRYDAVLLATGGEPKMPSLPGSEPPPYLLRTVEDADRLLDASRLARHVVLIGSSFISMEAASALRERGLDVTVISREKVPFVRQLGPQLGQMLLDKHLQNGVRFRPEANAVKAHALGRSQVIELDSGERLVADFIVSGVGIKPATQYLQGVPLNEDSSINVDASMRVEGTRNVYAAGDLAAFPLPRTGARTRIEHWRLAQEHGRIAAANMLGLEQSYEGLPYFWTYHYGVRYEYFGHAHEWDSLVVDGDFQKPEFIVAFVRKGRCVAFFAANRETETARLFDRTRRDGPVALEQVQHVAAGERV